MTRPSRQGEGDGQLAGGRHKRPALTLRPVLVKLQRFQIGVIGFAHTLKALTEED